MMKPIIQLYMKNISWGTDKLASAYTAYRSQDNVEIIMNPKRRFGEPVVMSCGYTAQTLWEACINEGSIEAAARVYGLEEKYVEAAYRYYDSLQGKLDA
jgi:uncharacterized protein (DUF433 family)